MRKSNLIILGIILVSFIIGGYFYQQMPAQIASHWNEGGEVNGYMPKFWGVFLMPIISVILFLMFLIIPKIDPLKENLKKFRKYFDGFIIILMLFFLYIYILTIFWNLGSRFNMTLFMLPAMSILFYYCGILIENSKQNWFIGIRTPWTLSSEKIWEKTHKLGGKLFKAAAVISLLGIIIPDYAFLIFIVIISFAGLYPVIYSYLEYKKTLK
jgi:uncharacterized membrane protein